MPSIAEELITLRISAASYFFGSLRYGFVSFRDFFFMTYYTICSI